jgi:hypothetical protein
MVQSTSHSTRNNICNWSSEVNCNLKRFPVFRQGMRTHVSVRFLSKILFVMENDLWPINETNSLVNTMNLDVSWSLIITP